jgi:CelD/BcsL family acetyltransferase involved in cellulose biosynthesis
VSRDGLRVAVARDLDALEDAADEWDDLLRRQPLPSPTLTTAWLSAQRGEGEPRVVLARREGKLVAGGAFRVTRAGRLRTATWLGGNRLPGILADPEEPPEVGADVIRAMRDECEILWLTRVNSLGPTEAAVAAALPWARWTQVESPAYMTPLPPPRLAHARSRAAYESRRAERKGAKLEIAVARRPGEILAAFDRLVELYLRRWETDEAAGAAYSDVATEQERYRQLLPVLAARDTVRIVEVLDGGRLLASLLGLVHGAGAFFHTTATDPSPALRGPGHLAMLAWVDEAIALGATGMYLGRGGGHPQGPKARLGATEVPLVDVLASSSRSLQPVLAAAAAVRSRVPSIR